MSSSPTDSQLSQLIEASQFLIEQSPHQRPVSIEDLEDVLELPPRSPPANVADDVDLMDSTNTAEIISHVISNMRCNRSYSMLPKGWKNALTKIKTAITHPDPHSRNALTSLVMNMTRADYKENEWYHMLAIIIGDMSIFSLVQLPPVVESFLTCQRGIDAFTSYNHSQEYRIPPMLLACQTAMLSPFRGWVAFNNFVVIDIYIFNKALALSELGNQIALMDLCTLVGHESKHGDIRKAHSRFTFHTPDEDIFHEEEAIVEAGKSWEKTFWHGLWPSWCEPIDEKGAKVLAQEIYDQLETTHEIVFTDSMIERLISQVGTRDGDESGVSWPGIDLHRQRRFIE